MSTHLRSPHSGRDTASPRQGLDRSAWDPATARPALARSADAAADDVARIALARRDRLLRVHAHRLRREDLEDCFSQAALELLARARAGPSFASPQHVANALEQKLISRISDRRRALSGRSAIEAALAHAPSTNDPDGEAGRLPDRGAGPEELVARRAELARVREVAHDLTPDQRRFLALHWVLGMGCEEFCRRHDWTAEKFRKVGQRARRRLAMLLDDYANGERCRHMATDLLAEATLRPAPGAGPVPDGRRLRVERHLANCSSCRRRLAELRGGGESAAVPAAAGASDQRAMRP